MVCCFYLDYCIARGIMEFLSMVLSEDNIRTLVIIVAMACGFIWQEKKFDTKMDKRFNEYDAKMDKKFDTIDKKFDSFYQQLKTNDFAHLNNAISELTFILEKNGFLKVSDREHINSKLDK
jgi:hypothetical protein